MNLSSGQHSAIHILWAYIFPTHYGRSMHGLNWRAKMACDPNKWGQTEIVGQLQKMNFFALQVFHSLFHSCRLPSPLPSSFIPRLWMVLRQAGPKLFISSLTQSTKTFLDDPLSKTCTFCISRLLPPLRDSSITSRLRTPSLYPRPATRTKRYTSFIHYALLNYQ